MAKFTMAVVVLIVCAGPAQQPPRDPPKQATPAPNVPETEASLLAKLAASPGDKAAAQALALLYNRQGNFDKEIGVLEASAAANPLDPQGHQLVAVSYWEKASKDRSGLPTQKLAYISDGIAATDRALALDADYVDALTFKNILLRMQANSEPDATQKQQFIAEADALRTRAIELSKLRTPADATNTIVAGNPPPPPPPPSGGGGYQSAQAPLRVGGNIKTPTKIRHVNPVYPPEAQEARIQGVVILETTIDPSGFVSDAKVLRSIPLLDQAAVDAVMQWEFTPTMLNGAPVPVIMTVTVNFTLM